MLLSKAPEGQQAAVETMKPCDLAKLEGSDAFWFCSAGL
jgi:hypothetical protein